MKFLGIIPARGGSKGVPLKNIKPLCGKPLIAYSIESALNSGALDKVVVTTDHSEIEKVAISFGAEVIRRPLELAADESLTEPTLIHVLDVLQSKSNYIPDVVLTLEPTSPFRSPQTIQKCIDAFENGKIDSVIGVVKNSKRMGTLENGLFNFILPDQKNTPRRQDRKPIYEESGTIWATKSQVLRDTLTVFGDAIHPLEIPEGETLDINTQSDFQQAEQQMGGRLK